MLPPKPNGSHETSRIATPTSVAPPPPLPPQDAGGLRVSGTVAPAPTAIADPGEQWLPQILQDKS